MSEEDIYRGRCPLSLPSIAFAYVGKKYWIIPNPKAISPHKFHWLNSDGDPSESEFVVTEARSFTVAGYFKQRYRDYVKIIFQDEKVAFVKQGLMFDAHPDANSLFDDVYVPSEGSRADYVEYILTTSPADLQAAERKQKAKSAAAAAAKLAAVFVSG